MRERETGKGLFWRLRQTAGRMWRHPAAVRGMELAIRGLLGAVLSLGQVLGGASPFGVALVAASGGGWDGACALVGAVFGYMVSRGARRGLGYAAACTLVFSLSLAFYDTKPIRTRWLLPAAAAALNAATGLVVTAGHWTAGTWAVTAGEGALTALGAYAFRRAFSLWEGREERRGATLRQRMCLVALGLAVTVSLAEVELPGAVSVGRLCAFLAALTAAYTAGAGTGAAVGVTAGLAMDLAAGGLPYYAMMCALSAVAAGMFRRHSRLMTAAGAQLAAGLALLWSWPPGAPLPMLGETLGAELLFLALPRSALERLGALFAGEERGDGGAWTVQAAAQGLRETAGAFGEVFSALRGELQSKGERELREDPRVIYDRAASRVCAKCVLRDRCWSGSYEDTHDLLEKALTGVLTSSYARAEHFPQRFRDRCVQFPAFLSAVGEELAAYRLRCQYRTQVGECRRAVCGQYGEVAQLLEEAAAAMAAPVTADGKRTRRLRQFLAQRELCCDGQVGFDPQGRLQVRLEGADAAVLGSEEGCAALSGLLDIPLAVGEAPGEDRALLRQRESLMAVAGVAGRSREGEEVTGDTGAWFKDSKGTLFLLLCDGMGSGREAREDSALALRLLEKFLRAGVAPENALKTLNQALVLRGEETGGFSTVDLLTLDLYSGQGTLYKLGAAPSYLKRGGTVSRLAGRALPAGVWDGDRSVPDQTSFRASPGDVLVMLTDGVLTQEDDGWLRDALAEFEGGSPTVLAQALVAHGDGEDDRTALVLRVGLRTDPVGCGHLEKV